MNDDNLKNNRIKWLITEYQELRKEIERRSKEQFICITGSIISLGSTLAFISSKDPSYLPLLIVIPWILTIFGFIWTDNSRHIGLLGNYLKEKIENQINNITDSKEEIGWQHYKEKNKMKNVIVQQLPFLYFILPSISCIIVYILVRFNKITELPIPIEISLISIGIIFIIILFINWLRAIKIVSNKHKNNT